MGKLNLFVGSKEKSRMTVALERKVKTVQFIPNPGERIFSVNLAMVDAGDLWPIAKELGLNPEIVQVAYRSGDTEIHAMLWQGPAKDAPADLETKYDELVERINPDAVRYALGKG
jgi:hypothetical protein